jgi:hypothetical protein
MATEIEIITSFDNSETIKGLQATEKEVKKTTKTLGGLTRESERLTELLESAEFGSDEFKKLSRELVGVNKEIKNTELGLEALDTDQVASEIGGLVGGFADVASGAVLAFGVSQESAEEFLQTFAQIEGAGRVVKGSIEGVQAGLKLYNNLIKTGAIANKAQAVATTILGAAQSAYTTIVGTSTGALKIFKIALASTGIGALIVGIGLLIANFDAVVEFVGSAVEAFGGLKNVLLVLLGPIGLIIAAWEFLFGANEDLADSEAELEAQRKKASEEQSKRTKARINEIKKERAAFVEAANTENEVLEKRAKILENNGKASDEARVKILENNAAIVKSELDAVLKIIEAKEQQFKFEQKNRGQSEAELAATLKAQGVDVEQLRSDANDIVLGLQLDLEVSESEITKFKRDQNAKRTASSKDAADKEAKIAEDLLKRRIAAQAALDQLEIDAITDSTDREIAGLQFKFEQRIAKLNSSIPEEQALILQLEQNLQDDITKIQADAAKDRAQAAFIQEQTLQDLRIQLLEGARVSELEQFEIDRQISNERFNLQLLDITNQLQNKEITEAEFRLNKELLEQEHENELTRIKEEGEQARLDAQLAAVDKGLDIAQGFVNNAISINESFNQIQDNLRKEGEAASLKQQKNRFNREKAFNIASAAIDTAKGITSAIAQFGPPPSPLGIAGIAAASAVGAAQIAAIASQRFNPSGGSGGASVGGGTAGFTPTTAGAGGGNSPAIPTSSTGATNVITDQQQPGTNQGAGAGPQAIQAYVLTNPLADAIDANKAIESQSEL